MSPGDAIEFAVSVVGSRADGHSAILTTRNRDEDGEFVSTSITWEAEDGSPLCSVVVLADGTVQE